MSNQADLFDVMERRDEAIARVVANADEREPGWPDRAYAALLRFCEQERNPFIIEEAREWAEARGFITPPHDHRAWGAIVQRAARAGVVLKDGYAPARSSNLSPKVRWRAR